MSAPISAKAAQQRGKRVLDDSASSQSTEKRRRRSSPTVESKHDEERSDPWASGSSSEESDSDNSDDDNGPDSDSKKSDDGERNDFKPYVMTPEQELVVQKMVTSCRKHGRFVNESDGGDGKTNMTVEGARRLNLPMVTVGLANTMPQKWKNHAERQGVRLIQYITWDMLRGARKPEVDIDSRVDVPFKVDLKHPYLTRTDVWDGTRRGDNTKVYKTTFRVTRAWKELVAIGVMLVCDEVQKAKNDTLQNLAVSAMSEVIFSETLAQPQASAAAAAMSSGARKSDNLSTVFGAGKGGSCIVALSATILDKPEQALRICKTLGLLPGMSLDSAFSYDQTTQSHIVNSDVLQRLLQACKLQDEEAFTFAKKEGLYNKYNCIYVNRKTGEFMDVGARRAHPEDVVAEKIESKDRKDYFMLMIYSTILRPLLAGAVAARYDADPDVHIDLRNVVYQIRPSESVEFLAKAAELERARVSGASQTDLDNIAGKLESLKTDVFVREARKVLEQDPQSKVFIVLNYRDAIASVAKALKDFGSREIHGGTSKSERTETEKLFQEANKEVRVIVGQVVAATAGIDLHDVSGNWTRHTFISPSQRASDIAQAMKRTKRQGVKGSIYITIVFGGTGELLNSQSEKRRVADEVTTMQRLIFKSITLKSVAQQQARNGVPFPSDLPVYRQTPNGQLIRESLTATNMAFEKRRSTQLSGIGTTGLARSESPVPSSSNGGSRPESSIRGSNHRAVSPEEFAAATARPVSARMTSLFREGDRVKWHYQTAAAAAEDWTAAIVVAVERGAYRIAYRRGGKDIVHVSVVPNRLRALTGDDLIRHASLWEFDSSEPRSSASRNSPENLRSGRESSASVFRPQPRPHSAASAASAASAQAARHAPVTSFDLNQARPGIMGRPSNTTRPTPRSTAVHPRTPPTQTAPPANAFDIMMGPIMFGVDKANGLSCLSNDWPMNLSPDALNALTAKWGAVPPPEACGFSEDGVFFPSVTHFCHYQLAAEAGRKNLKDLLSLSPDQLRSSNPLPLKKRTNQLQPNAQRYMLKGLRAKFANDSYERRVLLATGERLLSAASPVIDDANLLTIVRTEQRVRAQSSSASTPALV